MQLGKKKAGGAFDKLRQELGTEAEEAAPLISSAPAHQAVASPPRQSFSADHNPITILISEVIEAGITKDGSVKSYEIKGDLALRITDASLSKIRLDVAIQDPHGAVFKTHPNVDKAQFNSSKAIQPKVLNKPFPANGQALEVLRWRHAAKGDVDASDLPISFTVWFNRGSGSDYTLTVEYELQNPDDELRDLVVSIPFVTAEPTITSVDEVYEVNGDTIDWSISRIDRDNASGAFEIEGVADDESELFPMSVRFSKETPVINVDVSLCIPCLQYPCYSSTTTNSRNRSQASDLLKKARRSTSPRPVRVRASSTSSRVSALLSWTNNCQIVLRRGTRHDGSGKTKCCYYTTCRGRATLFVISGFFFLLSVFYNFLSSKIQWVRTCCAFKF